MGKEHFEPPKRGIYLLPNLFTITALFAGFYAIVAAIKGHFDNAGIATFVATVMDALDGRVARLTHTQTAFGAELDSLSDVVCFGVAPALIVYLWGLDSLGKAGWLIAFVFAMSVALRLARFNTQQASADKRYFKGLACTAGAPILVSMVWSLDQYDLNNPLTHVVVAIVTVLVSILMISNVLYHSFKDFDLKNRVPFVVILLIVLFFVLSSVDPPLVWLILSLSYALSGPIFWLWRWRKKHGRRAL